MEFSLSKSLMSSFWWVGGGEEIEGEEWEEGRREECVEREDHRSVWRGRNEGVGGGEGREDTLEGEGSGGEGRVERASEGEGRGGERGKRLDSCEPRQCREDFLFS